ncbi:hypothetical protein Tco_0994741 [Tanacetum coccineum]
MPTRFTPTDDDKTFSEGKKTSHLGKSMEDKEEFMCSGHFKKVETPRSGGSILQLMEDVVKVPKKLIYNKEKIHKWIKVKKDNSNNYKKTLKANLVEIDILLDKGKGNSDILNKRFTVSKALQDITN